MAEHSSGWGGWWFFVDGKIALFCSSKTFVYCLENVMIQGRGDTITIRAGFGSGREGGGKTGPTCLCTGVFCTCFSCCLMYARHFPNNVTNTKVDGWAGLVGR
jgi:hypothetical protein